MKKFEIIITEYEDDTVIEIIDYNLKAKSILSDKEHGILSKAQSLTTGWFLKFTINKLKEFVQNSVKK